MASEKTIERDARPTDFIRELAATERALTERSVAIEQEKRSIVVPPEPLPVELQIVDAREKTLADAHARASVFTDDEKKRLESIEQRREHWNPLVRVFAGNEKRALLAERDTRVQNAVQKADRAFRHREISKIRSGYTGQCRDRREGRERLVRLDAEQRGIGRDLRAVEGMRKEVEAIERSGGTLPLLDRERLRQEPRQRLADLRAALKTGRGQSTGRARAGHARDGGLGLEPD